MLTSFTTILAESGQEIREKFSNYFQKKQHEKIQELFPMRLSEAEPKK
jgi:hypothetical protein